MRVVLRHLLRQDLVAEAEGETVARFLSESVLPGCPPYRGRVSRDQVDWTQHPAAAPWREAVAALERDTDVPLPGK